MIETVHSWSFGGDGRETRHKCINHCQATCVRDSDGNMIEFDLEGQDKGEGFAGIFQANRRDDLELPSIFDDSP